MMNELIISTFDDTGYGDPTSPAPLEEVRGTKIALLATVKEYPEDIVAGMYIEEDRGSIPIIQENFPGYLERWRQVHPLGSIFWTGNFFKPPKYRHVGTAAIPLILAAFDVMKDFGVKLGIIVINPEEKNHLRMYSMCGFKPIASVDCMKGMTNAPGLLMAVTPNTRQDEHLKRLRNLFLRAVT
jgi:hypothetical protein